jgi:hypothetical protein
MVAPICSFCGRISVRSNAHHKRYFNPVDDVISTGAAKCACVLPLGELEKLLRSASEVYRRWEEKNFPDGPPDRSHEQWAEWVDVNRSLDWLKTIARGKGSDPEVKS